MNHIARGSLEVKLPNMDRCSNSCESSQGATVVKAVREEKESVERRARCAKKKKSRKTVCFFQCVAKCFVALEGRKVGSPERPETSGGMKDQKLHVVVARSAFPSQNDKSQHLSVGALLEIALLKKCCAQLWHEARFQVKMTKAPQRWSTFGNCESEKVYADVARSTFDIWK